MYERITGVQAPIKQPTERVDREAHKAAMQRIVQAAGHSRATKANAYLSTHAAMDSRKKRSITREMAVEALAQAGGIKSRAAAALGVSRQALYRLLER
jgi:DNA-binding NtrC family response regulator